MIGYLLLLFIALPVIELALLLEIGRLIGVLPTVGVVILTGAAGAALARSQGFRVISRIKNDLSRGVIPGNDIVEGALVLAGGIMLLTPGFITDLAGFSALIPATRSIMAGYIRKKIKIKTGSADKNVFDAEVYEIEND